MEDFKKNFILLSQVAKEKKYAQEYLGLLARRGDIGSIRIGKRWYTTWTWFEEFLKMSQKKKEEAALPVIVASAVELKEEKIEKQTPEIIVETKVTPNPALATPKLEEKIPEQKIEVEEKIKISLPAAAPIQAVKLNIPEAVPVAVHSEPVIPEPVREISENISLSEQGEEKEESSGRVAIKIASPAPKIQIAEPKISEWKPIQSVPVRRESNASPIRVRNTQNISVRRNIQSNIPIRNINQNVRKNISAPSVATPIVQRSNQAIPQREIQIKKKDGVFSPALAVEEKISTPFFPRFAFALSFAIIIFLVGISGYFVHTGGLLKNGVVAGASDERNGDFLSIMSQGENFLTKAEGRIKESISISRLMVEAVQEKTAGPQKTSKPAGQ